MNEVGIMRLQNRYARVAGFVYLLLIALFIAGQLLISHVTGAGGFGEHLAHLVAGQTLYRAGMVIQLLASLFTVLLAYALYMVLKPVNEHIARLAMYFRLGEAFAGLTTFVSFAALDAQTDLKYLHAFGAQQLEAIVALVRSAEFASFNITILYFSFGSTLFFYLFMQTRHLPRALSALGVFASALTLLVALGNLIWPAHVDVWRFGWIPIFIAEIATGVWLLTRGVRAESPKSATGE